MNWMKAFFVIAFLETFLGGMETSIGSSGIVPPATLKPSLVEWKQTKTWAELAKWYNP